MYWLKTTLLRLNLMLSVTGRKAKKKKKEDDTVKMSSCNFFNGVYASQALTHKYEHILMY